MLLPLLLLLLLLLLQSERIAEWVRQASGLVSGKHAAAAASSALPHTIN
jgi:hypothetical protein